MNKPRIVSLVKLRRILNKPRRWSSRYCIWRYSEVFRFRRMFLKFVQKLRDILIPDSDPMFYRRNEYVNMSFKYSIMTFRLKEESSRFCFWRVRRRNYVYASKWIKRRSLRLRESDGVVYDFLWRIQKEDDAASRPKKTYVRRQQMDLESAQIHEERRFRFREPSLFLKAVFEPFRLCD